MDLPRPPDGDTNRGPGLLALEVILTSLALFTTVLRVGIRAVNKQLGWDDATIAFAMSLRMMSFVFTMLSIAAGNGRHEYYLQPQQIMDIIKYTWGNEVLIFATVCVIKISICLYIFRIKKTGVIRPCLWCMMVGLVLANGAPVVILLAQCTPLYAFWDRTAGTCWNIDIYNGAIYASVAYGVITDLICTALPVIILWKVKISHQVKAAICGLMSLGLIASACATVRAYLSALQQGMDLTFTLVTTDEWAFAEADVGIIAANLALGRMIYLFFRARSRWHQSSATHPSSDGMYSGFKSSNPSTSGRRSKAATHGSSNLYHSQLSTVQDEDRTWLAEPLQGDDVYGHSSLAPGGVGYAESMPRAPSEDIELSSLQPPGRAWHLPVHRLPPDRV